MTDSYENTLAFPGDEPQEWSVPVDVTPTQPQLGDLYAVLVDIHRMEAEKLAVIRSLAGLINDASAQLPAILDQLQESPLFSMLSGGGGLLGSLFRR